jgi:uridylate kinase
MNARHLQGSDLLILLTSMHLHTFDIPNPVVISVGGAMIVPKTGIAIDFLQRFNDLIRAQVSKGRRFILVAGGGHTCRQYCDASKAVISDLSHEDIDWLGIHATRLNGQLLRTIFVDIAHPRMIENYEHRLHAWTEPLVIAAGWKPGASTDHCTTYLAHEYGAHTVINLSNIDYVYDKDPHMYTDAKPQMHMTWTQMQGLVGAAWVPTMHAPFDPVACAFAKKHDLSVIVCNGNNLTNLENILTGSPAQATLIQGN